MCLFPVLSSLQGAVLSSSDRGGIRIQYSRNPFGRREPGSLAAGGLPDANHPMGAPVHDTLASTLGTGNNSPRGGVLSSAGLLGSLAGSAASSGGPPVMAGGALPPVLVGQAGLEQILNSEV